MRVRIPSPLYSYTGGAKEVAADGRTLHEVVTDLDARYPGLAFRIVDEQNRIRPHIKLFLDGKPVPALDRPVEGASEVMIVCALSGG